MNPMRDPMTQRLYLLDALHCAGNDCEITFAQVTLRVWDREYAELKSISFLEKSQSDI